jgi:hypothetical protein
LGSMAVDALLRPQGAAMTRPVARGRALQAGLLRLPRRNDGRWSCSS